MAVAPCSNTGSSTEAPCSGTNADPAGLAHAAPPRPSPFDAALTADLARWSLLEAVRWRLAASWAWGPCRARRFFFRDALSPIFFGGILTTTRLPPLH